MRQRVKLMTGAVNAAGARSEVDRRSDVLKVFIAPEFYFRSMYGGYTDMKYFSGEDAGHDPNSIVDGLANAVQDERWKDWLFVFGTSVVVAGPFISPDTSNSDLSRKIAVLNTALVQKGCYATDDERTSKAVAVVKDYKSGEDFEDFPDVKFKNDNLAHLPAGPTTTARKLPHCTIRWMALLACS